MPSAGDHVRIGISGAAIHCMGSGGDTYCGALQRRGFRTNAYTTSKPVTCKACKKAMN